MKRQEKGKKEKEKKIAAVPSGLVYQWKTSESKEQTPFHSPWKASFWEAFEDYLIENFEYEPTVHKLVINGDGSGWITACREHFNGRAFFSID